MAIVVNKKDLEIVLSNSKQTIVVKGKLAKRLRPLSKIKKAPANLKSDMSPVAAGKLIGSLSGISLVVAIKLIVTVGVVTIVAILKDYSVKTSGDEVILDIRK